MAELTIDKQFFQSRDEVMADLQKTGFWPTTYVSNRSPELPLHYHDHDIIGYVIEGETYLLDENKQRLSVSAGDRMVIPKGAWHAEGEVLDRVLYIVSFRDPVPFAEGIMPREPQGPFPRLEESSALAFK